MVGGGGILLPSRDASFERQWSGTAFLRGPQALALPLLTLGSLGAQVVWSVEMAYASPYLLELGMAKSGMAVVFVAGPLSGLLVQPLIGIYADKSISPYGRRRPFMLAGCVICAASILLLGYTKEAAALVTSPGSHQHASLTMILAVLSIFGIDFSVNAVMAVDRALVVDMVPTQQELANAWASRMAAFGSVLGFLVGNVDLPAYLPFLGDTQLKLISLFTTTALLGTHAITAWAANERRLLFDNSPSHSAGRMLTGLVQAARELPKPIVDVFRIQFFAWIAWFPILFYSTVWVGDIYTAAHGSVERDEHGDATRAGSRAMFFNALISLSTSILLPMLSSSADGSSPQQRPKFRFLPSSWHAPKLSMWWTISHFIFAGTVFLTWPAAHFESVGMASAIIAVLGFCWALTNWAPFTLLGVLIRDDFDDAQSTTSMLMPRSRSNSTIGTTHEETHLLGRHSSAHQSSSHLSTAFAGQGSEVENEPASPRWPRQDERQSEAGEDDRAQPERGQREDANEGEDDEEGEEQDRWAEVERGNGGTMMHGRGSTAERAGVILGLHNVAIVLPQFLITLLSSLIFALVQPDRLAIPQHPQPKPSTDNFARSTGSLLLGERAGQDTDTPPSDQGGSDAIGLIFRIGGVSALVAGILALRMTRARERSGGND